MEDAPTASATSPTTSSARSFSLLPTKDGARTQILASRWRHLWHSAPLNLDSSGLLKLNRRDRLAGVVSCILSSHQGPGRCICIDTYDFRDLTATVAGWLRIFATVDVWLRSAALCNLQELDLCYSRRHPVSASISSLSTTLRVATIEGCYFPDGTVQGLQFPQLKQLTLQMVSISECSLHHMIVGCPALESLLISRSSGFRCIRINSLSLRSIRVYAKCPSYNDLQLGELVIENAPCLKRLLHLDEIDDLHISVISAPKLETLRCLSNSTKISFGSAVIKGLCVDDSLTTVVQTVKILAVDMNILSLDTVINLMRFFPCLEKLYIECSFHSFQSGPSNAWHRKHQNTIRRFDTHLKEIVLEIYRGIKSQVSFLTFFVLNAKLLELMTLGIRTKDNNEEFLAEQHRKLQLENRVSRDAQFNFTTDRDLRNY